MGEQKNRKMRSQENEGKRSPKLPDFDSDEGSIDLNRKRKHTKTRSIQDLVDNSSDEGSPSSGKGPASTSSERVLPEKPKLKLILETLKKRDGRDIFKEPVNPDEVEGYYDTIKEPMDFGTMTLKLDEGSYRTLAEFEHDVALVYKNAMRFNASNTVFYRQARYIKELALKLFARLKADPENFERAVTAMKIRAGRRREETGVQIAKTSARDKSTKCMKSNVAGSEEDQHDSNRSKDSLLNRNELMLLALYKQTEQLFPVEDKNLDEEGDTENWKWFVANLSPIAEMVADPKLSADYEAPGNHSANTPRQQVKMYEMFSAPSWNMEDFDEDFLSNPLSSKSGAMDILGGQMASGFDTLDYGQSSSRGFLSFDSGVGNPNISGGNSLEPTGERGIRFRENSSDHNVAGPYFSASWNSSRSNSNEPIPSSLDKGKGVMQEDSNPEESPENYSRHLARLMGQYARESAAQRFMENNYPAPRNGESSASGSLDKGKNVVVADPASLYPFPSESFSEKPSLPVKEREGTYFDGYLGSQGIGSSNPFTFSGAGNPYLSDPGPAGMNPGFVPANPVDNHQRQSAQFTGEAGSALNELVPNQGYGAGYFTNLLLYGIDPYSSCDLEADAEEDTRNFIRASLNQAASSVLGPGVNFTSPSLQLPAQVAYGSSSVQLEPASHFSLNPSIMDVRQLQAPGGSGGSSSNTGQSLDWPQPFDWLMQPDFYLPMPGQPGPAGAGSSAEAAAMLMEFLRARGGADDNTMPGPSTRNYPPNP